MLFFYLLLSTPSTDIRVHRAGSQLIRTKYKSANPFKSIRIGSGYQAVVPKLLPAGEF